MSEQEIIIANWGFPLHVSISVYSNSETLHLLPLVNVEIEELDKVSEQYSYVLEQCCMSTDLKNGWEMAQQHMLLQRQEFRHQLLCKRWYNRQDGRPCIRRVDEQMNSIS